MERIAHLSNDRALFFTEFFDVYLSSTIEKHRAIEYRKNRYRFPNSCVKHQRLAAEI